MISDLFDEQMEEAFNHVGREASQIKLFSVLITIVVIGIIFLSIYLVV